MIAEDLGGTTSEAIWAGTSFLLASAVVQPPWTAFAEVFGSQRVLQCAIMMFAMGSVICAVSRNFTVMIFGRSVQGFGSGGVSALTYLIVAVLITLRERTKWFSFVTSTWVLGTMSGPLLGGVCAQVYQWV